MSVCCWAVPMRWSASEALERALEKPGGRRNTYLRAQAMALRGIYFEQQGQIAEAGQLDAVGRRNRRGRRAGIA